MKIFKPISLDLAVAFTSMSGHGALAQDFDKGVAAAQSGDFATALKELQPLAEQGVAAAQAILGLMYDNGNGVPQDHVQAAEWYRKAAKQGNAVAQSNLGEMYFLGDGVPQDFAQAVKWLRKAAEQGNPDAQTNLGWMYQNGDGVSQDYAQAVKWYRKSICR